MKAGARADAKLNEAAGEQPSSADASSGVRDSERLPSEDADARSLALARIGERIGEHTMTDLLGVGGTAAVFRAVDAAGREVAFKLLHASHSGDPRVRKRFLREARIAAWIDHPRVARVLATGETKEGSAYHVMELREGVTLEKRRESAPDGLSFETVLPWMNDLLSVLAAAHEKGIVHRDIKPANLILDRAGRVHLLDFGIVRLGPEHGASSLVTRSGVLLGTVPFMPPEQALGRSEEIDARSDVWAVGATMFTLITGKLVHPARSVNEALVLAATQPAPKIRKVDPSVPKPIAAVIDRALAFDKADRFEDAAAMRDALRQASGLELTQNEGDLDAPSAGMATLPEESVQDGSAHSKAGTGTDKLARSDSVKRESARSESHQKGERKQAFSWRPVAIGVALAVAAIVAGVASGWIRTGQSPADPSAISGDPTASGAPVLGTSSLGAPAQTSSFGAPAQTSSLGAAAQTSSLGAAAVTSLLGAAPASAPSVGAMKGGSSQTPSAGSSKAVAPLPQKKSVKPADTPLPPF